MEIGWIKLHRKLQDCWIWQEKPFDKGRAWVDLLLSAMHHDKKILINNEIVIISRGSFMTSIVKLSERWGWSRNKVVRYLNLLEKEQMLDTERTPNGTLINIVKYEDYQISEEANESTHGATNETASETPVETPLETADESQNKNIKNYKNDKNEKNEGEYAHTHEDVDFEEIWRYTYEAYPKKSNHASAKTEWMNKLLPVVEQNRKEVSKIIWKAVKAFVADYTEKNPDDTAYRYIPTFNKWMTEDLDYWMAEVERRDNNA